MNAEVRESVSICEVGPRDGLQNAEHLMLTEAKKAWVTALAAAGFRQIEVGSFVPPKLIPAMADTAEQVAHALTLPGVQVVALVPNQKGLERAIAAGAHKVTFPVSASYKHSLANVRMTPDDMVAEVARSVARVKELAAQPATALGAVPAIEATISTAFGCTIQGDVPEDEVVRLAAALAAAGVDSISLADTVGYANPAQIKRLVNKVRAEVGERLEAIHLHNTRGLGLANALAAFEEGIRSFDSAMAGLGGCPFAPGAGGNIVTEDLVFMFESMGVSTGIDMRKLLEARAVLSRGLPGEPLHGHMALAGLPKTMSA